MRCRTTRPALPVVAAATALLLVLPGCREEQRQETPLGPVPSAGPAASAGDSTASVVVLAVSDYQCPFCAQQVRSGAELPLEEAAAPGRGLRLEHWDIASPRHAMAGMAAHGVRCAARQGAFVAARHAVFQTQDDWAVDSTDAVLRDVLASAVRDTAAFTACLAATAVDDSVTLRLNLDRVRSLGVRGTPAYVVRVGTHTTVVRGAAPAARVLAVVDSLRSVVAASALVPSAVQPSPRSESP